jgi:hypothetical protein
MIVIIASVIRNNKKGVGVMNEPRKPVALFKYVMLYCECGSMMCGFEDYTECINPTCDNYGKKFKTPSIELEEL